MEEAYLLAVYVRSVDPNAILAMGPVPTIGEDESFPGGFTIRAEKCPNRRGVEAIASRLAGEVLSFDDLLPRLSAEEIQALWVTGSYPNSAWIDEVTAERLGEVPLLIVADLFPSPLWEQRRFSVAERRICRARGVVRQCHRSPAIVRVGHTCSSRRCLRGPAVVADCWAVRDSTVPRTCFAK